MQQKQFMITTLKAARKGMLTPLTGIAGIDSDGIKEIAKDFKAVKGSNYLVEDLVIGDDLAAVICFESGSFTVIAKEMPLIDYIDLQYSIRDLLYNNNLINKNTIITLRQGGR